MVFKLVCVLFGVLEVRSESPGDLDETERSLILIESRSRVVKLCPAGKMHAHASEEDEALSDIVRGSRQRSRPRQSVQHPNMATWHKRKCDCLH